MKNLIFILNVLILFAALILRCNKPEKDWGSRTKEGFEASLHAFETLVKSYIFIADKVVIEKEKE